jgi:biotin carboxylase
MKKILFVGYKGKRTHIDPAIEAGYSLSLLVEKGKYKPEFDSFFSQIIIVDDIFDWIQIEEKITGLNFDGVLTRFEEYTVIVSAVSEHLGIDATSYEDVHQFRDKYLMKKAFQTGGVSCSEGILISNLDEAKDFLENNSFPLILKQTAGVASRFVAKVTSREDLEEQLKSFQETLSKAQGDHQQRLINHDNPPQLKDPTKYFLLETLLTGVEVTVDSFVTAADIVHTPICKYTMAEEIGVDDHHLPIRTMPFLDFSPEITKKIFTQTALAIRSLGAINCVTHTELFVDEATGDVSVIEIAARGGGMRGEMVTFVTDDSYDLATIEIATGKKLSYEFAAKKASSGVNLVATKKGTLSAVDLSEISETQNLLYFKQKKFVGDKVVSISEGGSGISIFVIGGTDYETTLNQAKNLLTKARATIEIE